MSERKALVVKCLGNVTSSSAKFYKKALAIPRYENGEIEGIANATICAINTFAESFNAENNLLYLEIKNENEIETLLSLVDRQTTIAIIATNGLFLYGISIAKIENLDRLVYAKDIIPTLAYITGFPIFPMATGAVIYQALKDPNQPSSEIEKLKIALSRMESAMSRENKEPWDKHDCA